MQNEHSPKTGEKKGMVIDDEGIRLSSEEGISKDLNDVVKICKKLLKTKSDIDVADVIRNERPVKSSAYYAALAVIHAEQAISNIADNSAENAAYNAMRAAQYQNLAIVKQTDFTLDKWADKRSKTGSVLINNFSEYELYLFRKEIVARLRQENVMEAMIPRHCARIEGNYHSAGMAPKSKVDKIKKYLVQKGLINEGLL